MPDNGPYTSERQANAAAIAAVPLDEGWSILRKEGRRDLLHRALSAAGVETSDFEERTLAWLAGWEDYTVAIVAGWVARAAQRPEETAAEWGYRRRGSQSAEPCISEKAARYMAGIAPDKMEVVTRKVTPWTPVPGEGGRP